MALFLPGDSYAEIRLDPNDARMQWVGLDCVAEGEQGVPHLFSFATTLGYFSTLSNRPLFGWLRRGCGLFGRRSFTRLVISFFLVVVARTRWWVEVEAVRDGQSLAGGGSIITGGVGVSLCASQVGFYVCVCV